MKEFEIYDEMMARYYEPIAKGFLPLSSWEFYAEHNALLEGFREDLDTLRKLTKQWVFERDYQKELVQNHQVIVVTNPQLKIVYATHNIHKMSGYSVEEVIGKSPKMFQGYMTSEETSRSIRKAVTNRRPFEVSIINYKKDNSTYVCKIKGYPVLNKKGKLINYIAFEKAA